MRRNVLRIAAGSRRDAAARAARRAVADQNEHLALVASSLVTPD
jgi:hypothetical protein